MFVIPGCSCSRCVSGLPAEDPEPLGAIRIPLVMYVDGEAKIIGVAEIFYYNEDEREKFSRSEVLAEAIDILHDHDGNPIHTEREH